MDELTRVLLSEGVHKPGGTEHVAPKGFALLLRSSSPHCNARGPTAGGGDKWDRGAEEDKGGCVNSMYLCEAGAAEVCPRAVEVDLAVCYVEVSGQNHRLVGAQPLGGAGATSGERDRGRGAHLDTKEFLAAEAAE